MPAATGEFGAAADLSGDTLVIGGVSSSGNWGAAYVYGRSNGAWLLGPTLTSNVNGDGFGSAVAVDGGTVAVGAAAYGSDGTTYVYSCPSRP